MVGDFLLSKGLLLAVKNKEYELLEIMSATVQDMSEGELLQIEKARKLAFAPHINIGVFSLEKNSKSWEIFSKDSKITMDIVITVCGNARDEECPYWSGNPIRVHWGVPDPANVTGSNSEKQIAFETTYNTLEKKAKAFLDLKFENMTHDILQKNINNISRVI